jgi:hypothetical protein
LSRHWIPFLGMTEAGSHGPRSGGKGEREFGRIRYLVVRRSPRPLCSTPKPCSLPAQSLTKPPRQ